MKSFPRMMRKKTLRKLGKTFTKKYNFKRLLQTAPDILNRYTRHEDAINSIKPYKHIQIFDLEPIRAYNDADSAISVHDTVDFETFGPGASEWPQRIKYAEQILDIYSNNYYVWAVEICGSAEDRKSPNVEVTRYQKPTIAHHSPIMRDMPQRHNCRPIFSKKALATLDQNHEDTAYFLIDDADNTNTVSHLRECGLIPDGFNIYGATFYNKEIAYLYADSLVKEMKTWPAFR